MSYTAKDKEIARIAMRNFAMELCSRPIGRGDNISTVIRFNAKTGDCESADVKKEGRKTRLVVNHETDLTARSIQGHVNHAITTVQARIDAEAANNQPGQGNVGAGADNHPAA
ncbi:hypothetical protein MNV49_007662 [Pseudohyphozyma bogoriensis]|nr:hypothetical protein MNV49_007662 [Pseudohyphozyma bogoriensis]